MSAMFYPLVVMFLITFVPGLELRASLPFGFFGNGGNPIASLALVFFICVAANILLGIMVFTLMGPVVDLFRRWRWFDTHIWPIFERTQHKLKPFIDKYGTLGVAIFIGIPLPGSGVYTGAFGSYLLGLDRRQFALANALGVIAAGVAVFALCWLFKIGALGDDSLIVRLLLKMKAGQ